MSREHAGGDAKLLIKFAWPNVRGAIHDNKKTQIQVISCNEKRWCPVPAGENSEGESLSDRGESMEGGGEGGRR